MRTYTNRLRGVAVCALATAGLAAGSCAQTPSIAPEPGAAIGITQIEQLIGKAACRSDSECRAVGVGAKACGGPEAYRAWSTTQTDGRELEALVARDVALRRRELERLGMASNCMIVPVPGVACVSPPKPGAEGRCVLVPSAAGIR